MAQRLTMEGIKQLYPEDKWILLLPSVTKFMGDDSPIWGLDVTEIEINPDSPAMVYDQKGKDALTRVALDRLAGAAGLSIKTKRLDDRSNRDVCGYWAEASLQMPWGGEPIRREATKEWDARDYPEPVDREKGRTQTETKAINRAIAMILGIPRSFPRGILNTHKFAIAKYVLVPDMSDPEVKRAVIAAGISAHTQLYAGPPPVAQLQAAPDEAEYHPVDDAAGLESVVGTQQERAEGRAREAARPRTEEPQAVRDERALLGQAPAQEIRADGRSATEWAEVEPSIPHIQAMLARCQHAKVTGIKRKYLNAYTARDAAKVNEIYNWLLDQELAAQGGN